MFWGMQELLGWQEWFLFDILAVSQKFLVSYRLYRYLVLVLWSNVKMFLEFTRYTYKDKDVT